MHWPIDQLIDRLIDWLNRLYFTGFQSIGRRFANVGNCASWRSWEKTAFTASPFYGKRNSWTGIAVVCAFLIYTVIRKVSDRVCWRCDTSQMMAPGKRWRRSFFFAGRHSLDQFLVLFLQCHVADHPQCTRHWSHGRVWIYALCTASVPSYLVKCHFRPNLATYSFSAGDRSNKTGFEIAILYMAIPVPRK